ncbi:MULTISPECIES: ThiF family adenylyltransferase [Deinococcus]|uniref:ThiF family adenylyltransferase n=1 Tax=Deinococcus rufus TaxID=2136097 RepID=A0ABV7Z9N9_9DEIO|nr:ThiF family adenylyltransferase [Deinococcus sp. AB2017081]WQE97145.1 ThiF family adenylyltransferase [Deinococcus sp. AB2017081]
MGVHFPLLTTSASLEQLCTRLGRELLLTAAADRSGFLTVTEIRRTDIADLIIVTLHPEIPTYPVHPIQRDEPIAFLIPDDPDMAPEVYALREDFPGVPHLIRPRVAFPGQLCLFDRPYAEYRARLSGQHLVERTLLWLKLTALGTLHGEDQPLEALMHRRAGFLVLPAAMRTGAFQPLDLVSRRDDPNSPFQVIVPREGGTEVALLQVITKTMTHGVIRREPRTLGDLHTLLLTEVGTDLLSVLGRQLRDHYGDVSRYGQRLVILHLRLPKSRTAGEPFSSTEDLAFMMRDTTLSQLGQVLDVWEPDGAGGMGMLLGTVPYPEKCSSVALDTITVLFDTSRQGRAAMSGLPSDDRRFVALGAGALGSQVVTNLVRAGQGTWVVADDDVVLPHNLVRHALFNDIAGWNKAKVLSHDLNRTFQDTQVVGLSGDALKPRPDLQAHLDAADVILDFTASSPVGRRLALSPERGRRASAFLNPTGQDLVLLVESSDRQVRLDHLEHSYLQALVDRDEHTSHYGSVPAHLRYGGGCRDISAQLPQDLLALHAATVSRALRRALAQEAASAVLWRTDDDGAVTVHPLPTGPYVQTQVSGWIVHVDPQVIATARAHRDTALSQSLPVETGGTLVGSIDLDRQHLFVTGLRPPPTDSRHYPAAFERGVEALRSEIEHIEARSAGALTYLGEWHTHPRGFAAQPSRDDQTLLAWLHGIMAPSGFPGVMLIIGEHDERWLVQSPQTEVIHGPE